MKRYLVRRVDTGQWFVGFCLWTYDALKARAFKTRVAANVCLGIRVPKDEFEIIEFTMVETGTTWKVPQK